MTAGTGLNGGGVSGAVTLNITNTGVTAGSYTNMNATVNAQGQITTASNGSPGNIGTITTEKVLDGISLRLGWVREPR